MCRDEQHPRHATRFLVGEEMLLCGGVRREHLPGRGRRRRPVLNAVKYEDSYF